MKGRKPKPAATRQRRNRASSAASLPPESASAKAKVPTMPEKNGGWTKEAKDAWEELFRSPMREKFLKADLARQRIYIDAIDRYWRAPSDSVWAQIRLEGDNFGTSPMARRRLEWEIRDQQEQPEAVAVGDGRPAPKKPALDPRNVLVGDFKK